MNHAYIDESQRPGRYLLTAAIVPSAELQAVTTRIRAAQPRGQQRSHMSSLDDSRKRQVLRAYVSEGIGGQIVVAQYSGGDDQPARDECLEALVTVLVELRVKMMILDGRRPEQNALDRQALARALEAVPSAARPQYAHRGSKSEPLLSLPDAYGWAWGAGGAWRKMVAPVITVVEPGTRKTRRLLG